MTATATERDPSPPEPAAADTDPAVGPGGLGARVRAAGRGLAPLALELAALTTFVFARPALSSLGSSPETFITRGADWTDVLAFLVVVLVVPAAGLVALDALAGAAGPQVRRVVHAALVGVMGALVAWQIAGQFVDMSFVPVGGAACGLAGLGLGVARYRTEAPGTFLRYAALIVVVVVAQFAFMSPSGGILLGGRHVAVDADVRDAVAAAVGDDGPPVVLMVFDGLPTDLLLDGQGAIDPELYPNLAELAGTSTWYRNNTTVAPVTMRSVPAILSGRLEDTDTPPLASSHPENIFTMLGGTYDVHALEPLTGLCPVSLCPVDGGSPLNLLLGDARAVWKKQMGGQEEVTFFIPGAFDDRYDRVDDFLDAQDFGRGDAPDAYVMHVLLPHEGWDYLDDGTEYQAAGPVTGMWAYNWSDVGADVGRQRHILQAQLVDRIVGRVMDEMRSAGTFDDAVMVVTADHGYAFDRNEAVRGVTRDNFSEIMWTPLIVKSPGQQQGVVDDRNTETVDVLPTIAHELGVDLPWDDLDGVPASEADRDPGDKSIADWAYSEWRAEDGGPVEVDGEAGFAEVLASDPVRGHGPLALWDRSDGAYGDLVGRSVDELAVEEGDLSPIVVGMLDDWKDVDPDRPPIELLGYAALPLDSTVAVSVDGTIAAVVPVVTGPYGSTAVHALLWPDAVSAGDNDIGVWVLGGTADSPTLTEIPVRER